MRVQGLEFEVDWAKFRPGTSFFIPCLNINEAKISVGNVCKRLKYTIEARGVIENNVRGLRVWRIK